MENNDTNTDYTRFVRVGDQNWEIVQVTIGIISSAWDLYSLFIIPGDFKPRLKKITPPPKVSIPTQNPNLTLYKRYEKCLWRWSL